MAVQLLQSVALLVGILLLLSGCGWWALAPFRKQLGFPIAVAPLAGMVLLPLAALGVAVPLSLPMGVATGIALPVLLAASVVAGWGSGWRAWGDQGVAALATLAALSVASVWFVMQTDLVFGAPGLTYFHGSDHLGYAQLADWIRGAARNTPISPDPRDWYSSWPHVMLTSDPRFGSVALLAIVGAISRRSSAFAYDLTCAIVLVAVACGLAGVTARRRSVFLAVAVGLFTSFWFDWSRTGYLGKITGMPATMLVAGLYMVWTRRPDEGRASDGLAALVALVAGAALMFSGLASGFLLTIVGFSFVMAMVLTGLEGGWWPALRAQRGPLIALVLLVGVAVLSSGVLARPLYYRSVTIPWSWWEVMVRATELESLMMGNSRIPALAIPAAVGAVAVLYLTLAVTAVRCRLAEPMAWLAAPVLLLVVFGVMDARWHAMNFIGVYASLALCGCAALVDALPATRTRRALVTVLVALVALHLPRFEGAARFYGGNGTPAMYRFSATETEALATLVGQAGGALVDVGSDVHLALFLSVELGRRGVPLQWSEASWKRLLGYRPWPVPSYQVPATLRITKRSPDRPDSSRLLLQTTQFDVFRNQE